MKIDKKFKLELAGSTDKTRPVLHNFSIGEKDGGAVAVATNGKLMAVVPVEMEDGEVVGDGAPLDLLKRTRAFEKGKDSVSIKCQKLEPKFPDWKNVLDIHTINKKNESVENEAVTLYFDSDLFLDLVKAMGGQRVKLTVYGLTQREREQSCIVVQVSESPDAIGLLMPLRND